MVVGVGAAGNRKAQQVEAVEAVFAGHGVAVGKDIAYFATADACFAIEFNSQCLRREFFFGYFRQNQ